MMISGIIVLSLLVLLLAPARWGWGARSTQRQGALPPRATPLRLLGSLLQLRIWRPGPCTHGGSPRLGGGRGRGQNSGFLEVGLGAGILSSLNEDRAEGSDPASPERG